MNTLQKIGLGIGAITLSTLPFFMNCGERPKEELVDVLCRDSYESGSHIPSSLDHTIHSHAIKKYDISTGRISVLSYTKEAWPLREQLYHLRGDSAENYVIEGADIEDPTPQTVQGQRIKGCKIVDEKNVSRKEFSPQELAELESLARTDLKYRAMEREVIEDVDTYGATTRIARVPLTTIPYLKDWLAFSVSMIKQMDYDLDDGLRIRVNVNASRGNINEYYLFNPETGQSVQRYIFFESYDYGEQDPMAERNVDYLKQKIIPIDIDERGPEPYKVCPIPCYRLEQLVEVIRKR